MGSFAENSAYYANTITGLFVSSGGGKIILDPLTTIIRIASLRFRPQDTKLTFSPYSITFDYPTTPSILQGAKRRWSVHRPSKNDITILKDIIILFIGENDLSEPITKKFAEEGAKGLQKLASCYKKRPEGRPIVDCIEFYITILRTGLSGFAEEAAVVETEATVAAAAVAEAEAEAVVRDRSRNQRHVWWR